MPALKSSVSDRLKRKLDVLKKKKQEAQTVNKFKATYCGLLNTLHSTYPESVTISQHKTLVQSYTDKHWKELMNKWRVTLDSPLSELLRNENSQLFKECAVLFDPLDIHALWDAGKLTENSKKYLWMYLNILLDNTIALKETKTAPQDIAPPFVKGDASKLFQNLCGNIPMNMMQKVQKVAESYGKKLSDTGGSIEDIKFEDVSKELFKQIDASEIQQLVSSVSSLMKNIGKQ